MKLTKILFSLLLASSIASCNSSISSTNYPLNTQTNLSNRYSISGSVSFPSKNSFVTKATLDDIAQNATVSLIYPNNHPTLPNKTISTGLTDSSGSFTLFFDNTFNLNIQDIFILEATRRISSSSNKLMSVRTFVKWNGGSWDSITSSKIKVNSHTTALCAITTLIPTLVNPSDTINSISIVDSKLSPNDIKKDNKVVVTASNITDTSKLVDFLLLANYDPIQYIAYKDNSFYLKEPKKLNLYSNLTVVAGNYLGDEGIANKAKLNRPKSITFDSLGNIYIADSSNNRVRKVDKTTGIITTVAGGGTNFTDGGQATNAQLELPYDIKFDIDDNLYISSDTSNGGDYNNIKSRIRKVDKTTGIITTVAGGGTGFTDKGQATNVKLNYPTGIAFDNLGNLYISENERIRKVDKNTGIISTFAGGAQILGIGDGGQATNARLYYSRNIAFDSNDNLYITEIFAHRIRKVDKNTGIISTFAGNGNAGFSGDGGLASNTQLNYPTGITFDSIGNMYISDSGNYRIRKVDKSTGIISTIAGNVTSGFSGDGGLATNAQLEYPEGIAFDRLGNLSIVEGNRIRKVDKITGIISTVVNNSLGDGGLASNAQLNYPSSLVTESTGNLYIAEENRVRKVDKITGTISTIAGNDTSGYSGDGGLATNAQLNNPYKLILDSNDNLYILDKNNNRIRKVDKITGIISTFAGNGNAGFSGDGGQATNTQLNKPQDIIFDALGNIYVADTNNNRIRKVDKTTGIISTVVGTGASVSSGDGGLATNAQLNYPRNIAFDNLENLYISDASSTKIRRVDKTTGIISTFATSENNSSATISNLPSGTLIIDKNKNIYIITSTQVLKVDTSFITE